MELFDIVPKAPALTVLSFGAGQESTYLLLRILYEPAFRKTHVSGRLLVVGSDTGDEHDHTHENIEKLKDLCKLHGVEFIWVKPHLGYHSEAWTSLTQQYRRNKAIGSAAYRQTCTDNLKVKVVDRFVEGWIQKQYGYTSTLKKSYLEFYRDHGPIRLILGFAKGEESRTANGNKFDAVWKKRTVERYYPLIEEGVDRQQCIDYNEAILNYKVWPSNCMRCFYQSDQEILWLHRNHPDKFEDWVEIEQIKLTKYDQANPPVINLGVYGKITLQEKLAKAQAKYGHWSDEQLNEYKYSHGHCIKTRY